MKRILALAALLLTALPCVARGYTSSGYYHTKSDNTWMWWIVGAIVLWFFYAIKKGQAESEALQREQQRINNLPENVARREAAVQAKEAERKRKEQEAIIQQAWFNEQQGKVLRGEAIPLCIRHLPVVKYHVKAGSGVYFLFDGAVLAYVGKAGTSVNDRVESHRRSDGKVFDCAWFMSVHPNHVDSTERELIRTLKPRDNTIRYLYG